MKKMLVFVVLLLLLISNQHVWAAAPTGTGHYAITGIEAVSAVAVKTDGSSFIKANSSGLDSSRKWSDYRTWFGMAFIVLVIMLVLQFFKKK